MDPLNEAGVVIETSVWVDYFRDRKTPQTEWIEREAGRQNLITLDVILAEVLQGVANESEFKRVRNALLESEVHHAVGEEIAIQSAINYRSLRVRGITIRKTIDCIIATYCIAQGFALLHKDRDFDPFERHLGLRVIHAGNRSAPIQ